MTTTTRITRLTALALATALLIAGCSQADDSAKEISPTGEATTPALEATEPATEEVEETPEAVEVPTEVGETVPADQVEAAREAGVAVYVSPNGNGEGIVVEQGVTPEVVVEDLEQAHSEGISSQDDFDEALEQEVYIARAAEAANTGVFILTTAPSFGADGAIERTMYVVDMLGEVEGHEHGSDFRRETKDAAIAAVQHLIDQNPGLELVDLT